MLFQNIDFILFLIITFSIYWLLPFKYQKIFLVIASYFFYCYVHQWFFFLLFSQTVISFFCGILLEKNSNRKKYILAGSIVINLAYLI